MMSVACCSVFSIGPPGHCRTPGLHKGSALLCMYCGDLSLLLQADAVLLCLPMTSCVCCPRPWAAHNLDMLLLKTASAVKPFNKMVLRHIDCAAW